MAILIWIFTAIRVIQILAIHNPAPGTRGRPSPHTSKHGRFPSPVKGIDSRISFSSNDPLVCIYAFNIVPSEYSLRVRDGYREYQIELNEGEGTGVRTIIPFDGKSELLSDDRLFAVTNEGIWDVTVSGGTPVFKEEFPIKSPEAGRGTYTHYLSSADEEFIYYADSINGLFVYTAATDEWEPADDLDFPDIPGGVASVNFVVVHKLRIWFGVQNSAIAYYLELDAIAGPVTPFNFGIKFKHGGNLVGMYNWTIDGGDGVDDYLIAVSRSGDILPYKGSDPSQSDWSLVGTYFIGAMASGSRCASQYGGNTAFLSSFGITQMSDLLRGTDTNTLAEDSLGAKISPLIRQDMRIYKDNQGWDIRYLQTEGVIIITSPVRFNGQYLQYVYNVSVDGWGIWRGVPITSVDVWRGLVYFGTANNEVMVMDVTRDGVVLDPPEDEINGRLIEFSMLHNYLDLDDPSLQKRGKFIRPDFLSKALPAYNAKFLYDYNVEEINGVPTVPQPPEALWDIAEWDNAFWESDRFQHFDRVIGGVGMGRYISVAIKGEALSRTSLVSTDITWDAGWFL